MSCKIIALADRKGGVLKTSATRNIAKALVDEGKKVLVVDMDSQASLSIIMGFRQPDQLQNTLADKMKTIMMGREIMDHRAGIIRHEDGIHLLPTNQSLASVELNLAKLQNSQEILGKVLTPLREEYSYILIDCAPSLSLLTINALTCCDEVIIPVGADYSEIKGMEQVFEAISNVKNRFNPDISINGILLTKTETRSNYTKEMTKLIYDTYGSHVRIFKNTVPYTTKGKDCNREGISIFDYRPKNAQTKKLADAYKNISLEVTHNERTKQRRIETVR